MAEMNFELWSGDQTDEVITERDKQLVLWSTVNKGDLTIVREMIDHGIDINMTDMHGNLVLHTAVIWQLVDVIQELLDAGSDVNKQNDNGQTPLHLATDRGMAYSVLLLLEGGAHPDIKTKFSQMTALHMAARNGHQNIVNLLLSHGANLNTHDCIGKIPEYYAANALTKQEFEKWRKGEKVVKHIDLNSKDHLKSKGQNFYDHTEGSYVHDSSEQPRYYDNQETQEHAARKNGKDKPLHSITDEKGHQLVHSLSKAKGQPVHLKVKSRGQLVHTATNSRGKSVQIAAGKNTRSVRSFSNNRTTNLQRKPNAKKEMIQNKDINQKLEFSQKHKARMATNVFDRLTGKSK